MTRLSGVSRVADSRGELQGYARQREPRKQTGNVTVAGFTATLTAPEIKAVYSPSSRYGTIFVGRWANLWDQTRYVTFEATAGNLDVTLMALVMEQKHCWLGGPGLREAHPPQQPVRDAAKLLASPDGNEGVHTLHLTLHARDWTARPRSRMTV